MGNSILSHLTDRMTSLGLLRYHFPRKQKTCTAMSDAGFFWVDNGARTHDLRNHNPTL